MGVGDKVIVVSDPTPYRGHGFITRMDAYCGKIVTIKAIYPPYRTASIVEDGGLYIWVLEWFRPMKQRTE